MGRCGWYKEADLLALIIHVVGNGPAVLRRRLFPPCSLFRMAEPAAQTHRCLIRLFLFFFFTKSKNTSRITASFWDLSNFRPRYLLCANAIFFVSLSDLVSVSSVLLKSIRLFSASFTTEKPQPAGDGITKHLRFQTTQKVKKHKDVARAICTEILHGFASSDGKNHATQKKAQLSG